MIVDRDSGNFSAKELGCRCCGTIRVHEAFLGVLEKVREATKPLHLISCSRCYSHNSKIGGHKSSLHLIDNQKHLTPTIAADVSTVRWSNAEKLKFAKVAEDHGLSMGLKRNSIHVDYRHLIGLKQIVFFYGYTPEWCK